MSMPKRSKISSMKSKSLFRKTANKTNVKNLPSKHYMMRGGSHF